MKTFHRWLALLSFVVLSGLPAAQAVTCTDPTIPPTNPDSVYTANGDGTVSDTRNGLIWKQCAEGQSGTSCSGSAKGYNWGAALRLAAASNFAGHSDWRLPNVKELLSLVEECRIYPAINDNVFYNISSSNFWSSSTGWYVEFGQGTTNISYKDYLLSVRLVRRQPQAIEFYHSALKHYFISTDQNEAASIDAGAAGAGWARTGGTFNVFPTQANGSLPVCRFYGSFDIGPNSHFFTVSAAECAALRAQQAVTPETEKKWHYENTAFYIFTPINGACTGGSTPVYRYYNNGFALGEDSNHRLSTDLTQRSSMEAAGWSYEGIVMCAP